MKSDKLMSENIKKFFKQRSSKKSLDIILVPIIIGSFFIPFLSVSAQQAIDFRTSEEIKKLNSEIENKSSEIDSLTDRAGEYAKLIEKKQSEERSLSNELSIIDNRVIKTQLDIKKKEVEIDSTNLKIRETELTIDEKAKEIDLQKLQLSAFLREMHRQDSRGRLEIFLVHKNLSDFFGYVKNIEEIQANIAVSLSSVKDS